MIRRNRSKTEPIEISASMHDAVIEMMGGMLAEATDSLQVTLKKLRAKEDEANLLRAKLTYPPRRLGVEYRAKMS